jgi:hypothetical protein
MISCSAGSSTPNAESGSGAFPISRSNASREDAENGALPVMAA